MEPPPAFHSAKDRERALSADPTVNSSSSSRVKAERGGPRHEPPARPPNAIQPSPSVPRGVESMLKTATETGDIGVFSIKGPRFPPLNAPRRSGNYRENGPRGPAEPIEPYHVPTIDDRRSLPSYTIDATHEGGSLSRSSGQQKSSRVSSDPDDRSFALIQASCDEMSKTRSYSSLKSQLESNLLERPRPPHGYSSAVRHSDFTPSSPTSTSGGGPDHHPRADADRIRHGTPSHSTSSPSSLYPQKRKPPVTHLPEANRSTASSRESTANNYLPKSPPSSTAAPARLELRRPHGDYAAYYDAEDYYNMGPREPAPHPRMTTSIPEGHAMGTNAASMAAMSSQNTVDDPSSSGRISSTQRTRTQNTQDPGIGGSGNKDSWPFQEARFGIQYQRDRHSSNNLENRDGDRAGRLPIGEYGVQDPSRHAHRAFNHPSFGPLAPRNPQSGDIPGIKQQEYTSMPSSLSKIHQEVPKQSAPSHGHESPLPPFSGEENDQRYQTHIQERSTSLHFVSKHQKKMGSVDSNPVHAYVSGAVGMAMPSEVSSRTESPYDAINTIKAGDERTNADSPTVPDHVMGRQASVHYGTDDRQHRQGVQLDVLIDPDQSHYQHPGQQLQSTRVQGASDMAGFPLHAAGKSVSHSKPPLLAPKAVSPVRQLELSNSVPHLMEFLPHVQSDPSATGSMIADNPGTSYQFPPLVPQSRSNLPKDAQPMPNLTQTIRAVNDTDERDLTKVARIQETLPPVAPITERAVDEAPPSLPSHSRLKLKLRKSIDLAKASTDGSPSWNPEDSFPQSDHPEAFQTTSSYDNEPGAPETPKFRLKITRASNSTPDTVRINRDCGTSRPMAGSQLQAPSDLFTSSHGMDRIFRQVTKHLHSGKSSPGGSHQDVEDSQIPDSLGSTTITGKQNPALPQGASPTIYQESSIEERSHFSDDSSNAQGHHPLRKRISNLKARLTRPYSSKTGAQSYNSVSLGQRNRAARSVPNLHTNAQTGDDEAPLRHPAEHARLQKWKGNISRWYKGARSALKRV